tara:strand:+ start:130 stop:618 length:489 start_codon:yes stop_codon:yes gene_type:complete
MVAEVLAGIALVKQSVDFIKSNIATVKDISQLGTQLENLMDGNAQVQKAKLERGNSVSDQLGIKSVAKEVIDAKLAAEQMEEMRELIDHRFGWGTWKEIVALRQQRIKEEKERLEELRREAMKKQAEFQEKLMIAIPLGLALIALVGLFVYIYVKGSSGGVM